MSEKLDYIDNKLAEADDAIRKAGNIATGAGDKDGRCKLDKLRELIIDTKEDFKKKGR